MRTRMYSLMMTMAATLAIGLIPVALLADDFYIDSLMGSSGSYTLNSPDTLSVNGNEYIGYNGTGTFTQTGGTNGTTELIPSIGQLYLGYNTGSTGTYNLSGGQLSYLFSEFIGYSGNGSFNQSGGLNKMSNILLGDNPDSTGIYNLSGGQIQCDTIEVIGVSGIGIFKQSGGINSGSPGLYIGSTGSYNLSGGELGAHQTGEAIEGTFTQSGGTNEATLFSLDNNPGSPGLYNLTGGQLTVNIVERIGNSGSGIFTQTGGTHTVGGDLYLGYAAGSNGTYNLSGDPTTSTLTVNGNEYIGYSGTGTFNQSGGTHTVANTLTIAANPGSIGSYDLSGGFLKAGSIVNNGAFSYSGGTLEAGITNNASFSLSGNGTRTVNGDVTNNGTFKVTNTSPIFTGTFTNNGTYISDPAVNRFYNLIITQNGYLKGGIDDQFLISKDFLNYSTNTLWNTSDALLGFEGGGQHTLYQTGDCYWDTLKIFDGNSIMLSGTGTLYLENLIGLAFDPTGTTITNIWGNGLNLYYLAADNPWLYGRPYSLMGGGSLLAYNTQGPVPEPATLLLLSSGLLGLIGFNRKKLKR